MCTFKTCEFPIIALYFLENVIAVTFVRMVVYFVKITQTLEHAMCNKTCDKIGRFLDEEDDNGTAYLRIPDSAERQTRNGN